MKKSLKIFKNEFSFLSERNSFVTSFSKGFKTQQLHYYTGGDITSNSGIKVCIFGGNSGMGPEIGARFMKLGTPVNFVHRHILEPEIPWSEIKLLKQSNPYHSNTNFVANSNFIDDGLYRTRVYGDVGYRYYTYAPDLTNDWEIENAIKDCDVVINCIGNNPVIRHMEDFEEANIIIPRKIAKMCAALKNNNVKRLIHFSANGVDPDSFSKSFRTKWIGEKEVLDIFPDATIIRPTEIMHRKPWNTFIG